MHTEEQGLVFWIHRKFNGIFDLFYLPNRTCFVKANSFDKLKGFCYTCSLYDLRQQVCWYENNPLCDYQGLLDLVWSFLIRHSYLLMRRFIFIFIFFKVKYLTYWMTKNCKGSSPMCGFFFFFPYFIIYVCMCACVSCPRLRVRTSSGMNKHCCWSLPLTLIRTLIDNCF